MFATDDMVLTWRALLKLHHRLGSPEESKYLVLTKFESETEMLDEAMLRNPTQKLERPIVMGKNNVLTTIEQAVMAYKDELWGNLYNEALDSYNKGNSLRI